MGEKGLLFIGVGSLFILSIMANCTTFKLADREWANQARTMQINQQQNFKLHTTATSRNKYRQLSSEPMRLVQTREAVSASTRLPSLPNKNPLWHGQSYKFAKFLDSRFYSDNSMQKALKSEKSKQIKLTQESFMREELDTLHAINTQRQTFYKEDSIYRNRMRRLIESQQIIDKKYNSAATIIQKHARGFIARLKHNQEYLIIKKFKLQQGLSQLGSSLAYVETMFEPEVVAAAIKIQTFFRRILAKVRVERMRKELRERKMYDLKLKAAIKIQTHFRMKFALNLVTQLVVEREKEIRAKKLENIRRRLKKIGFKIFWNRYKMNIGVIARKYNRENEAYLEQDTIFNSIEQENTEGMGEASVHNPTLETTEQVENQSLSESETTESQVDDGVEEAENVEGEESNNTQSEMIEAPESAESAPEEVKAANYTKQTHSFQQKVVPKEADNAKSDESLTSKKKPAQISSRNPILAPTASRLEYMRHSKKRKKTSPILEPWRPPLISEPGTTKQLPEVKKANSLIRIPSFIQDSDEESELKDKDLKSKATSILDESDHDISEKDNLFTAEP